MTPAIPPSIIARRQSLAGIGIGIVAQRADYQHDGVSHIGQATETNALHMNTEI
jgi:hypothetical protein